MATSQPNEPPSATGAVAQASAAALELVKRGNAEELAFLNELAGVAPKPEGDATQKPEPSTAEPRPNQLLTELVKGNAEELAFLDELAGVAPKEEAAEPAVAPPPEASTAQAVPQQQIVASSDGTDTRTGDIGIVADNPAAEEKDAKAKQEEEETYELDATELLDAFTEGNQQEDSGKDEDIFKDFLSELKSVDRDNEVNRILWAFKLNPFEKMDLQFTATEADVRRQYRKISLLIHPDKCKHPQASEAFEVLQLAQKELLDEETRTNLMRVLEYARDKVREERRKATKHDSALRLATYLHGKGREGVEEDWEKTDDFHEKWKMTSRDVLAKAEFRRRKLNKRIREEEERLTLEEKEEAQERKKVRKEKQEWLNKRTDRIDSWRNWTKSGAKKIGGTKALKIKEADAERSYVQRATTEQFVGNYKKKPPK